METKEIMTSLGNPIIRHKFTADPTVLVHEQKVYLYTGHDEALPDRYEYVMNEWLCFSSEDLIHWTEHPVPLKAKNFKWASGDAYASNVIRHYDKFFWYAAVTHATIPGKAIGVAISEHPTGPFKDARGSALITTQMGIKLGTDNFDPSVLVDDDGQAYIFWGKNICYYAKLKENMIEIDGTINTLNLPEFQEGVHLHKKNGSYYLSYGYEFPEKVGYAMSRSITGPWEFKGILNEIAGNCETNRPAIIEFKGKDYFFYHNGSLKHGGSHRRSVCIDHLFYNEDGTMKRVIMSSEGVSKATH
ncbi:glycoside hydrolase family 43 protein [Chryseosolibacter indicus]|uniref:Glycoside hydrolase family 43 protein n=1 Tax=Chryseosolibacter indicus TaxID=2782351 RepID=A0ABS5VSC4_9BACT|nr:glycoside hydrolase family 43 protein [Chryseosolibacter indicus]MBT1703769.1 glycoside hydrolase family 43 protein [Chryseosolibacter indicus]